MGGTMTNSFDSFGRSNHGVFIRSPHGARGNHEVSLYAANNNCVYWLSATGSVTRSWCHLTNGISALAVDSVKRVYIGGNLIGSSYRVYVRGPDGLIVSSKEAHPSRAIVELALDSDDNLYVAQADRVEKFINGGLVATFNAPANTNITGVFVSEGDVVWVLGGDYVTYYKYVWRLNSSLALQATKTLTNALSYSGMERKQSDGAGGVVFGFVTLLPSGSSERRLARVTIDGVITTSAPGNVYTFSGVDRVDVLKDANGSYYMNDIVGTRKMIDWSTWDAPYPFMAIETFDERSSFYTDSGDAYDIATLSALWTTTLSTPMAAAVGN